MTIILKIYGGSPSKGNVLLYIYPTDTVWGLGASINLKEDNQKIREIKGNLPNKPLSVLFHNIETIEKYFDLPSYLTKSWPVSFFKLEATLALPIEWLKGPINSWIYGESNFIAVRCLPLSFLTKESFPITTTSLNLQGRSPITSEVEAREFSDKLKIDHQFITTEKMTPSGCDSTIVALLPEGKFKFWRQGRLIKEIQEICAKL